MKRSHVPAAVLFPILVVFGIGLILASFLIGSYPVPPDKVVRILGARIFSLKPDWPASMETVMLQIRLPRIAAALLAGGALASSGAAYQNLFRNPLVSPAILGVSAGAGFGASVAMLMGLSWLGVQAVAFLSGLVAVMCTLSIGRIFPASSVTVIVLAGLVVSAAFDAFISLAKYVADPVDKLPSITFWLMGSLGRAGPADVLLAAIPIGLSFLVLFLVRWQVNVLAMGEEEALALGVDAWRIRLIVILASTLMTAPAVSICGVIGWVGLLIPHIARMISGPNFETLLPVSLLLGGSYLLLVDDVIRFMRVEIPLGVLTALIGAPFFVFLLTRIRRDWA
jgi:iron complex transport system permease protein